jgi:hypothetical protein
VWRISWSSYENEKVPPSRRRQQTCNNEYILSPLLTHSSSKYKEIFAIINGEGERSHGATWWPAAACRVAAPRRLHASIPAPGRVPPAALTDVSESPRLAALVLPAGQRLLKWRSPPASAGSPWVVGVPRRRGACACGAEGRSGSWCVRCAAAGWGKPARVSSWAHRFNDSTPWNRESRRRGFRGGDDGARDRRSQPGSGSAGDGRGWRRCGWEVWCRLGL